MRSGAAVILGYCVVVSGLSYAAPGNHGANATADLLNSPRGVLEAADEATEAAIDNPTLSSVAKLEPELLYDGIHCVARNIRGTTYFGNAWGRWPRFRACKLALIECRRYSWEPETCRVAFWRHR